LAKLPPDQLNPPTQVRIINDDAFTIARDIIKKDPSAQGHVAVLNLASDIRRAGGWIRTLSQTQEEALCYSSTLYSTLKEEYFPWANTGAGSAAGIYSPAIVVFKNDLTAGCKDLAVEDRVLVSVITVAAPRGPKLSADRLDFFSKDVLKNMQDKIRLVYRMAAHNGQDRVVLGAMGCGAYGCPAQAVAREMKSILLEDEFKGRWKEVIFAVLSKDVDYWGKGNFGVFNAALKDVKI